MEFPFISKLPGPEGTFPKNLYVTTETETGEAAVIRRPGLLDKVDTAYGEGRALEWWDGYYYAVVKDKLYRINNTVWTATEIGTLSTSSGPVSLAFGATKMMVVDGRQAKYQAYGATSLTSISDDEAIKAKTVTYQDGYFIVPLPDSDSWYISTLDDPSEWSSLDEGEEGRKADDLVAMFSNSGQVIAFGVSVLGWYWNSGDDFPFTRTQGATHEIGLGAAHSPAEIDKGVCFLDSANRICKTSGNDYAVISTPEIHKKISSYTHPETARGSGVYWKGFAWYILAFPDDNKTWCFDMGNQMIWEITSGNMENMFRGLLLAQKDGGSSEVVALDRNNGKIYLLSDETRYDNGDEIIRMVKTLPSMHSGGKHIRHDMIQLRMKTGIGLSGEGSPLCELRYSDDHMKTWENYMPAKMGKEGERFIDVFWDSMGISNHRVYEFSCSAPVPLEIHGAIFISGAGKV